jgi:Peptidase A4 family
MPVMTTAARACAAAVTAAALALGIALATGRPVPRHGDDAAQTAAAAAAWAGYPFVPAAGPAGAGPQTAGAPLNITTVGSLNWAGYGVSRPRTAFQSIKATFFVPYLRCLRSLGATLSSDWVGLDGFVGHPHSVEQGGIAADCSAAGKATYYAWYEMFPRPETRTSISVRAGDSVTATVSWDATAKNFRITLTDNTRGGHFAVSRKCPDVRVDRKRLICPRNSAEVISEAPATSIGSRLVISHLSDYGAISFAGVAITDSAGRLGGIVSPRWNTVKIVQMRSSGPVIARPTPTEGATFDNYWQQPD